MRKIWRDVLVIASVVVSIPLIIILLICLTPRPPIGEMKDARVTLSRAGKHSADIYSKKLFTEARICYDSAMVNWHKENKRFIYFRNYGKVKIFAELSASKASQAAGNSISNTSKLKINLIQKIDTLNKLVSVINELFNTYPLTSEIRSRISNGRLLLTEGKVAFKKGQYLQANKKINDSEYLLTESFENASENLKNYFKSYSKWKKWVYKAISESKENHDYSIIIDKFSRKCFVYFSGAKKYEFEAELGLNWVGDKRVSGDKTTPEGMYKITEKFDSNETRYHKALQLDYPNDGDKDRFKSEIARGSLPASAKIGGNIQIHGDGGKGVDWTSGCIALTDKEMDLVFKIAKVGTPVTIVGSMIEFQDVVSR